MQDTRCWTQSSPALTRRILSDGFAAQDEYLANIELFVQFRGNKLLLLYPELVNAPATATRKLAGFLPQVRSLPVRLQSHSLHESRLEGRAWFKQQTSNQRLLEAAPQAARRQFMMTWRARAECWQQVVRRRYLPALPPSLRLSSELLRTTKCLCDD